MPQPQPQQRLYLSPIVVGVGSLRLAQPGRWYAADDFLAQFSTDILVEGSVDYQSIVRGVPSVFAQPIYFAHALGDRNHPAHAAAVGQWRGLLACFALKRWLELPLEVQRFEVSGPGFDDPSPDAILRTVLAAQLPAPQADWREWWILRCGGRLLGATSPWSMVYPPAQSQASVAIPWQRGGVLIDPIEHYDARRQRRDSLELALLAAWVEQLLAEQQNRWGASPGVTWDRALAVVTRSLVEWRDSLQRYAREEDRERELTTDFPSVQEPYGVFLRPLEAGGPAPEGLLLNGTDGVELIVLKRQGLDPRQRVHGATLVEDLDLNGMSAEDQAGWRTRTGREMRVPYVFADDLFLTEKLIEIPVSDHALSLLDGRFALPLRTEVFRFFTHQDLRERLRCSLESTDDHYIFRLSFPLADGSEFSIERCYERGVDVLKLEAATAPALALWPDFVSTEWKHSLALYVGRRNAQVAVAPVTTLGRPLEISPAERGGRDWVAWRSGEPLLGFVLYPSQEAGGGEAGLLLRSTAPAPATGDPDLRWRVSVDFGTSNTQLMVDRGDLDQPRPLPLRARTVLLTRGADIYEVEAREAFFPADETLPSPFPTVLLQNQGWAASQVPGSVPGDLYSPRFSPKPGADLKGEVRNLKWPREGGRRGDLPIRSFLSIVVQGILAEARSAGVSNVVFHWSYPLALPPSPRAAISNFWQTVPATFDSLGLRVRIAEEGGRSESEAMSRYFANLPGDLPIRAEALSVALDVGGGSTDVGFWSAGRFLDQVSFKLGGNDLLVPLAKDVPRFLESLFEVCQQGQVDAEKLERMRRHPEVSVNAILNQTLASVPQAIHGRLPAADPPWSIARTVIYLYFAGVVFYLGLHTRRLLDRVRRREFALLFGGKAAALLPWLSNDPSTLERILSGMFLAGLGYDDTTLERYPVTLYGPGIRRTGNASSLKVEVAHGLLLPALPGEKPTAPTTTVVGELGWRASADAADALPWDREVDLSSLANLHAPDNLETGFAPYLAVNLAPRHVEELGLDVERLRTLRLGVADVEDTVRTLATQGVLQPVFAGELKRLIQRYLEGIRQE